MPRSRRVYRWLGKRQAPKVICCLGSPTAIASARSRQINESRLWAESRRERVDRPLNGRRKSSLFFARAFEAQCRLRANLKAPGGDFGAAPHTLPVGAIRNSCQGSLYRGDLTRDERSLPFERNVILHLDRLFGGIGIKRFGQIPCNPILPSFEFGELRLETGFGAAVMSIAVGSLSLRRVHSKS